MIARFRRRHSARMAEVFRHVLKMCDAAWLVRLGMVALAGTQVKAKTAVDADRAADIIDTRIERMMHTAADQPEDARCAAGHRDEVPADLRDRRDRQDRLKADWQRQAKLDIRAAEERATGRRQAQVRPQAQGTG